MKDLGRESHYSYDRPAFTPPRVNLVSYPNVKMVLEQQKDFQVVWGDATAFVFGKHGWDFMLSGDTALHSKQRDTMSKALYQDKWHESVKEFYQNITLRLLQEKSCKIAGINQVDITRE